MELKDRKITWELENKPDCYGNFTVSFIEVDDEDEVISTFTADYEVFETEVEEETYDSPAYRNHVTRLTNNSDLTEDQKAIAKWFLSDIHDDIDEYIN